MSSHSAFKGQKLIGGIKGAETKEPNRLVNMGHAIGFDFLPLSDSCNRVYMKAHFHNYQEQECCVVLSPSKSLNSPSVSPQDVIIITGCHDSE